MSRAVAVATNDLESALAYLEGLSLILQTLDSERRGRDGSDPLVEELQKLENALYEWSPMPHQATSGQGWAIVDHNLEALRQRLSRSQQNAESADPS